MYINTLVIAGFWLYRKGRGGSCEKTKKLTENLFLKNIQQQLSKTKKMIHKTRKKTIETISFTSVASYTLRQQFDQLIQLKAQFIIISDDQNLIGR